MATLILYLQSGDRGCVSIGHLFNFTRPLQKTLVSNVPTTLTIYSLDHCPLDVPFPFHKFLLMSVCYHQKDTCFRLFSLAKSERTSPPTQLQFSHTGHTEFVICDYAIEETFLDDKSNGFQVEATKLDDAQAMARLFLVLAVATLHFTSVGVEVAKRKTRRWVDTHWDRGMSYLKIGWLWLRQQSRKNWPVLPPFGLDPKPDPEPAIASRQHGAQPKRHWVVSCFGSS
jgi:hypothetical protein